MSRSTSTEWLRLSGVVKPGHGVASGRAEDSPYPAGTIALQTPVFQALGLDLSPFFPGTLNVSIAPYGFILHQPDYQFRSVYWTEHHPPEDFSFMECRVMYQGRSYAGLIYYPHPETKHVHFQQSTVLEVLVPWIEGIAYGDRLALEIKVTAIEMTQTPSVPGDDSR
jgi:hypothetical protein